jgi:hypothetical protein
MFINPYQVQEVLRKLKANRASGPDGVNVNVLRRCPELGVPLSILFNHSIQSGTLPIDWKSANITPLFKKGSRQIPNNYRPVSLTSQVVKILERLVFKEIIECVKINKTISCHQHGFQEGCSCITQLLECIYDWTNNIYDKSQTDIVYLDFAKAFDVVPHLRLIHKLKQVGIRGHILQWIQSFLTGRRQ